jgi:quaternary ammonium compound-resistance protein SugE
LEVNVYWIYLLVAGLFEIGFTTCLKLSDNFSKFWPVVGFLVMGAIGIWLLSLSMRDIPLGTAYAV